MTNDFRSYDHKQCKQHLFITHYSLLITQNTNTREQSLFIARLGPKRKFNNLVSVIKYILLS